MSFPSGRRVVVSSRFRLLRELGRGGMGIVWLVEDTQRGELVALKRARSMAPDALRRFKREFRVMERLRHPGLVRLLELGQDEHGLYLLMEPLDGVNLRRWCEGPERVSASGDASPRSEERVRQERLRRLAVVLPALAEALTFLHAHGIVHRDLKPSNVIVDAEGRPKLLDFGLLAEVGRAHAGELVGTVGYMAPELARGASPSPSSDVYALGAMCFELIAGEAPFSGSSVASVLARVLSRPTPRIEQCWPCAPAPLCEWLARAMAHDPEQRPTPADLARGLCEAAGARPRVAVGPTAWVERGSERRVLGREQEMAWLHARRRRACEGHFVVAVVEGPSGIGKTALCRAFVREVEEEGGVVVRGRARPEDRTPFGGLDEAMDDLVEIVERCEVDAALRRRLDGLRAEVGRLLPGVAPRRSMRVGAGPHDVSGAPAVALAEFVQRTADLLTPCSLVIFLDDAQWLDVDGRGLLRALLARRPPRVMLLLARRPLGSGADGVPPLSLPSDCATVLHLPPLSEGAVRGILQEAATGCGGHRSEGLAWDGLVRRCEGMPLLAELLGRAVSRLDAASSAVSEQDLIGALLGLLSPKARRAFGLLVAYDEWLSCDALAELLDLPLRQVEEAADELSGLALAVRSVDRSGSPGIRPYHDRVVAAARSVLPAEALRRAHRDLADWLRMRKGEPARRVRHLLACGDVRAARRLAPAAAARAEARRAWAMAARMYEVLLDDEALPREERQRLRRLCAEAWDQAGLHRRSIPLWRALLEDAEGYEALEASLGEVAALLGAARLAEAWERLRAVPRLLSGGSPAPLPVRRIQAAVTFLRGPDPVRPLEPTCRLDEEAMRETRLRMRLGTLMSYFDAFAGMGWLRRAQRRCEQIGACGDAAWCDYIFAHTALFVSPRRGRVPLAERYLRAAESRMERVQAPSESLRGMRWFVRGATALHRGDWREARSHLLRALEHVHRAGMVGTVEHTMVLVRLLQSALFSDDPAESAKWLSHMQEAARGRGSAPLRHHIAIAEVTLGEWYGRWDLVWRTGRQVVGEMVEGQPSSFARVQVASTVLPMLGVLRAPGRHEERLARVLRQDWRYHPMRTMYAGQFAALRARLLVRLAGPCPGRAKVRRVRRLAAVARRAPPFHAVAAERALARIEERAGVASREAVLERFEAAEREALAHGQRLQWALARHGRGLRLPGAEGASLRREAMDEVARLGLSEELFVLEEAVTECFVPLPSERDMGQPVPAGSTGGGVV